MRVEWDLNLDELITLRGALARQRKTREKALRSTKRRIEDGERRYKELHHDIEEITSLDHLVELVNPVLARARREAEG